MESIVSLNFETRRHRVERLTACLGTLSNVTCIIPLCRVPWARPDQWNALPGDCFLGWVSVMVSVLLVYMMDA